MTNQLIPRGLPPRCHLKKVVRVYTKQPLVVVVDGELLRDLIHICVILQMIDISRAKRPKKPAKI